jgi:two-component system, chemotaxis family, chemotaxis protein CheY
VNAYDLSEIDILVVEDNWIMRTLLSTVLNGLGAPHPRVASDGKHGLTEIALKVPDLVITDWEMAPMDGIQFVRHVRDASASPCPTLPIIMLTAHSDEAKVLEARDAGVTEFLTKPFTTNAVYQRIVRVIEQPRAFVRSGDYFGPDRRRKVEDFAGTERRQTDPDIVVLGDEGTKEESGDGGQLLAGLSREKGKVHGESL